MDRFDIIIENLKRIEDKITKSISPWLTIKEAALYIKSSERTLRRWIATGIVKTYRMPAGSHRILRRDVDSIVMFGKHYNKLTSPNKKVINELTKD